MQNAEPFLRWAGGKRWLAKSLAPLIAVRLGNDGTYFEPFLGAGAIFFAVEPGRAVLSDLNEDLVTTFNEVARRPRVVVNRLLKMGVTKEDYEHVRCWHPGSPLDKAVRFIYLNRNCYGGLYRENRHGIFNVPYGGGERNHKGICADGTILHAARVLSRPGVRIRAGDFGDTLKYAGCGDVVYCDPTYREVTRKQFDRYGKIIFRWEDQERLACLSWEACRRGAIVILSNATCDGVRELYRHAAVVEVMRRKGLGPTGSQHRAVEYVFILDPLEAWSVWATLGALEKPRYSFNASTSERTTIPALTNSRACSM